MLVDYFEAIPGFDYGSTVDPVPFCESRGRLTLDIASQLLTLGHMHADPGRFGRSDLAKLRHGHIVFGRSSSGMNGLRLLRQLWKPRVSPLYDFLVLLLF